jgi:hypothetical protein
MEAITTPLFSRSAKEEEKDTTFTHASNHAPDCSSLYSSSFLISKTS